MEKICPICNEINTVKYKCEKCGSYMIDKGRVQEYLDDYSADLPINDADEYCVHVFTCSSCSNMENIKIKKVIV